MSEPDDNPKSLSPKNNSSVEASTSKSKQRARAIKRRRVDSGSSSENEDELPENLLETENNVHASALKNNLDETSVRKIIKKVVTNDHVLAFVKLREEKLGSDNGSVPTKYTRSKVKELMKSSPKPTTWNLELTPIKHIPVKTRPEVTALIAQDLLEDEDDDEYKPTQEDVASDDDQTVESCSDLESQPRTPATPKEPVTSSPTVLKDGPFKVPQNVTATKRKLDLEEEDATIARRTRSKLSLSSTSIEHIESTFVPPDDIPMPAVDDLWNQFLNECLNPASTSKNEDDDEADPEYNVAADAEAADDDEESLSKSIIKISKKELSDLVTELFAVMPEVSNEDLEENLVNSILTDPDQSEISRWEGKKETPEEQATEITVSDRLQPETSNTFTKFSIGKTEPGNIEHPVEDNVHNDPEKNDEKLHKDEGLNMNAENFRKKYENVNNTDVNVNNGENVIHDEVVVIVIKEEDTNNQNEAIDQHCVTLTTVTEQVTEAPPTDGAPPSVQQVVNEKRKEHETETRVVKIHVDNAFTMLPEQVLIFQQQLRQHIQLATFNYLQLYVHPVHWSSACMYKEYLESLVKICVSNPKSVVNVCNLRPGLELMSSWESTTAMKTPENQAMVNFIYEESEKSRHRAMNNCAVLGEFPDQFKKVVANSGVFLYPHLLQPVPYRPDNVKRFSYTNSEDELIALGLEQFWKYVDNNAKLFKVRPILSNKKRRAGFSMTIEQIAKYMLPWMSPRHILCHVQNVRKHGHVSNPINKFFKYNKVDPVQHKLLPFNPQMTLYEHPESEIPRPWLKYLAKTSNRFRKQFARSDNIIKPTTGVPVEIGQHVEVPRKLPIPLNQEATGNALPKTSLNDECDVNKPKNDTLVATQLFSVVQTDAGMVLVPLMVQNTNVVNSQTGPISTPAEVQTSIILNSAPDTQEDNIVVRVLDKPIEQSKTIPEINLDDDHCDCCIILRKLCDKIKLITDYFKPTKNLKKECQCRDREFPKVSNRLKLFLNIFKAQSYVMSKEIKDKLKDEAEDTRHDSDIDDLEFALLYQMRFVVRLSVKINKIPFRKRLYDLFSKFNVDTDDPVQLAEKVHCIVKDDLTDIYNEFLGFLTAEQAENVGVFNHYLVSHLKLLMKKIDEDITDKEKRKDVLTQLNQFFCNSKNLTSCEICKSWLLVFKDYPQLARHVFSLFPHKKCKPREVTLQRIRVDVGNVTPPEEPAENLPENQVESLSGGEVSTSDSGPIIADTYTLHQTEPAVVKDVRTTTFSELTSHEEQSNAPLTSSNLEATDACRVTPDNSILILEDEIKVERQEWTREEDKVLLEIIKQYLASEAGKNKSIYKILQDNKVYELISENMTDKSMDEIVQRVLYLMEVLVVN